MRRLLSLVLGLALLLGCAAAETAEPRNEDVQITSNNLYRSATPAPRSEALIKFGFSELALEMNCFYGLKSAHNIDDFITFFLQNEIGANLVDPDAAKADQAIADLTNFWLDDGHSAYLSASYLSDSGAANKLGFGNAARGSTGSMLSAFRAQYPEASQPYYEVGDVRTYSRGKLVYIDGRFVGEKGWGRLVRCSLARA